MITFEETGLAPEILRAISEMGFEKPTPIQEKTIPHLLHRKEDLVALAQTGTGKTAAFGLPLIQNVDQNSKQIQSLILCPTRELCLQISRDIAAYSKYQEGIRTIAVYGGADIRTQISQLKSGGQIVVGTPGRVHDLIRRKVLNVTGINWLILDEADEMLTMGFKEEMDAILSQTPSEKQTLLFSATMPKEISEMSSLYLNHPEEIAVGRKNAGSDDVEHHYYVVHARDKYQALKRVADNYPDCYAIVFCRTRVETRDVAEKLVADGYSADALHGDLSQAQRDHVMGRFRTRHLQMLVATDVAARGLDVSELTHVINYSLPDDPEIYIHRSGRTGRAGHKGISVSLVNMKETGKLRQIEKLSGKKMQRQDVPQGEKVCEVQLMHFIDKVLDVEVNETQIEKYMNPIREKLQGMDSEDILKRFVSIEFNRFLSYYKDAPDLNVKGREREMKDSGRRKGDRGDVAFSRLFINAGKKQNLNASRLLGMINNCLRKRNIEIGKIDIQRKFSFFEIDSHYEAELIQSFKNIEIDGFTLTVDRVSGNDFPSSSSSRSGQSQSRGRSRGSSSDFNRRRSGGRRR